MAFRRTFTLLAMYAAVAVSARADTTIDDDGHFAARFPGPTERKSIVSDTDAGRVTMHIVLTNTGTNAYSVSYYDIPASAAVSVGGGAKRAAENINGKVRSEKTCKLGDVDGLEVIVDVPSAEMVSRMRLYIVDGRFFQVVYFGPAGSESTKDALAFLDSFRLYAAVAVLARADTTIDDDGHFAACFPMPTERNNMVLNTDAGKVTMHIVSTKTEANAYIVSYCEGPAGAAASLDGAATGAAENMNGKIRSETTCKLGDVDGREVIVDVPSAGMVSRMRLYIVGARLFQVEYIGRAGSESSEDALTFLDSFRLLR